MTESLADPNINKFTYLPKGTAERFVVLLPIINGVATILTPHYLSSTITPGVIRAIIILLFFIPFVIKRFPHYYPLAKITFVFVTYLFFLTLLSSSFSTSFNVYLKVLVSSAHILFGLYYGRNPFFLKRISISICIMLTLFMLDFIFANLFGYGGRSYKGVENELNFGATGVNLAKQVSAILLMIPVIYLQFKSKISKRFIVGLSLLAVIFVLFAFKRSAVVGLILGYLFIIYALPNKTNIIKWISIVLFFGALLSPFFLDQVYDNIQAREEALMLNDEENLEKQGRYNEYLRVTEAWVDGSIRHKLIGSELFNDSFYYKVRRMLHTDYMALLSGAGIIGLSLYLLIYYYIIKALKIKQRHYNQLQTKYFVAVGGALIIGMLFYGISGMVQAIEPRGTIFLFIGAMISVPMLTKNRNNELNR